MTVSMLDRKADALIDLSRKALLQTLMLISHLMMLLSCMIPSLLANASTKLVSKCLESVKIQELCTHRGNYDVVIQLPRLVC